MRTVISQLTELGVKLPAAHRILDIAGEHGVSCTPIADGMVTVTYGKKTGFSVSMQTGASLGKDQPRNRVRTVAVSAAPRYTSRQTKSPKPPRGIKMATKTAPAPAPAAEETEPDYTTYAGKAPTATMTDFADWLTDVVYGGEYPGSAKETDAFRNGVRLGGTLRMEFQRSDFNQERREERRAAPKAEADGGEAAPAAPRPTRGRPAKGAAATQPTATTATRGRSRGKPAAEAPF
jgi:hypothetical protein